MVQSIATFYAADRVTRHFGVAGDYTIVAGKHIGTDWGTGRQAIDVPALVGGRVVLVMYGTQTLGSIVVVKDGDGVYWSYCHLSKDRLPAEGAWISRGGRVGRLAAGPNKGNNAVPSWDVEWPGKLWSGIHLHLVAGYHPRSAFEMVSGHRTISKFINPATVAESVIASPASGGSRPLEDEMSAEAERMIAELYQALLPGEAGKKTQGVVHKQIVDILASTRKAESAASGARVAGESLVADFAAGQAGVRAAGRLFGLLHELKGGAAARVDEASARLIAGEIVKQIPERSTGGVSRADVEAAVVAGVRSVIGDVAKAVNDDAAARMKS